MEAAVIIPARYHSSRFPGKALAPLKNRPLLQHVFEKARACRLAREVIIATDCAIIMEAALSWGAKAVMTRESHPSGTDRVAEAASKKTLEWADVIVNLQGDEPIIRPEMIDDVITLLNDPAADIGTLARGIEDVRDFADPNVVKVVCDSTGRALYFSRSPIPFLRDGGGRSPDVPPIAWKHIGIYAYRREALFQLTALPPSRLEQIEKLEQLRALEHGMTIKVKETGFDTIGVDTPEDLQRVERWLNSYS